MRKKPQYGNLSRRERQIMDLLFRLEEATVSDLRRRMENPPSYSAVRSTVAILERKGHVTHRHEGNRYVYLPAVDPGIARRSALDHVLDTFFAGSAADAVTALIEERGESLSPAELERLSKLIRKARKEGR